VMWFAWPVVAALVVLVQVRRRRGLWHALGVLVLSTYGLWIASVLFFPLFVGERPELVMAEWRWSGINLVPFRSLIDSFERPDADRLLRMHGGNFLLLAPFTLLGPALWPRLRKWWQALLFGLGASLGIELAQLALRAFAEPPYRTVDIDDVILNTAGAMFGYGLFVAGRAAWRRVRSRRLGASTN
jgi:glycopeptide antibiotics resistance protein